MMYSEMLFAGAEDGDAGSLLLLMLLLMLGIYPCELTYWRGVADAAAKGSAAGGVTAA